MRKLKLIVLLCIILTGSLTSLAQDNTMYFTKNIAQRIELNPAYQNDCKLFIGLPVLSSVKYSFDNTGFGYRDIIRHGLGDMQDSLVFDLVNLPNVLGKVNFLNNTLDVAILSIGLRHQEYYFSLGISNHSILRFGYPQDLVNVFKGNWDLTTNKPRPLDFSGIGIDFMNYTSIGLGVSKEISSELSVGLRAKFLMGAFNLNTRRSNLTIFTDENPIAITGDADLEINGTFPLDIAYNEDGLVNLDSISVGTIDPVKDILHFKNKGVALDLGMVYNPSDEIEVAVSIVDLGFINWVHNATNFTAKSTFRFTGFNFNDYNNNIGNDTVNVFNNLVDSLKNSIAFADSKEAYKTLLTPKFFAGITYAPFDMLNVGALAKVMYYNNSIDPSFTVVANIRPVNFLSLSASWSYMNRTYKNIGFAVAIGKRIAQFYLAADNVPIQYTKDVNSGMVWPLQARTFNFRVGLNLFFGCGNNDDSGGKNRGGGSKFCPAYR